MKERVRKIVLWSIVIMCGLGIIGAGFELGTSDPAQTEPAVTGGQMSMVVVTTPVPIATIAAVQTKAAVKTKVATSLPTTVVTTVSTTKPMEKFPVVTSAIYVPPKGCNYDTVTFNKIGGGYEHNLIIENQGETTLSKTLELEFKENEVIKHMSLSIEVPPGETKFYLVFSDTNTIARINVVRCD